MPAIVGVVQINSIQSSCVFNIGDVYRIAPVASTKTFAGAGSFNTARGLYVYNHRSNTNTFDKDLQDMSNVLNV